MARHSEEVVDRSHKPRSIWRLELIRQGYILTPVEIHAILLMQMIMNNVYKNC